MAIDPNKPMKILCVCQKGCARSVGTLARLNRRGYGNVIAIGHETTAHGTLMMLSEWADKILLAQPHMLDGMPESLKRKVDQRFVIGPDKWGYWRAHELQVIIRAQLNSIGLR